MVCKVLIMLLLRLLFMFSNCGLQYFIVDIGGMEQQPLGYKKLRAYKRRDELFCRHAVIAKEPKRRKRRGSQDSKPRYRFRAKITAQSEVDCYGYAYGKQ